MSQWLIKSVARSISPLFKTSTKYNTANGLFLRIAYPQQLSTSADEVSETNPVVPVEEDDALYRELIVEVRGHDPAVLKSYEWFVLQTAKELNINVGKTWVPPKHLERYTLLKSVHIFRKHLVQYEMRTYFRVMQFKYLTGSTADTYLEYIQRNLPEGVGMKVTKHAIERLPGSIRSSMPS